MKRQKVIVTATASRVFFMSITCKIKVVVEYAWKFMEFMFKKKHAFSKWMRSLS